MVAGGGSIGETIRKGCIPMISALLPNYARADLAFERGEGAWLWTVDGRRFLDFGSGIATASLGHGHPHLSKAIAEQAAKVMHVSNLYRIPRRRAAGAAAGGRDVRRQRVLLQLGRGSERGHDQDDAPRHVRCRQARALPLHRASRARSTAARWRRSPPPATPSTWKASARWSKASTRCRSTT